MVDYQPIFTNLDRLPWSAPTVNDLKEGLSNRHRVGAKYKGVKFRIYDMCTPEGISNYENDKSDLLDRYRRHKVDDVKETSIVLNRGTDQHLHIILTWAEIEWGLYQEGLNGEPVQVPEEDITKLPTTDSSDDIVGTESDEPRDQPLDAFNGEAGSFSNGFMPFLSSN